MCIVTSCGGVCIENKSILSPLRTETIDTIFGITFGLGHLGVQILTRHMQ